MTVASDEFAAYDEAVAGYVRSPAAYRRYLGLLFKGVAFRGRSVLDVGGGSGAISYWAAVQGASRVVCLEPEAEGSDPRAERQFERFTTIVGGPVDLRRVPVQGFDPDGSQFDVVVLHNAVNHLDEEAVTALPVSWAQQRYVAVFQRLASITASRGDLVVADCGRRNAWDLVSLRSPFASNIEWHLHREPHEWARMLLNSGFSSPNIRWDAPSRLGPYGQMLLGNRVGAYLTSSHFILTMRKE